MSHADPPRPVLRLALACFLAVAPGCGAASHARDEVDGAPDGDGDGDIDGDASCPAPVGDDLDQVTTPMITTDPDAFVGEEVVVVGTIVTARAGLCTDDGLCGTCRTGLTLDGVVRLQGPGGGDLLCDEAMECVERVDSCLPHWECWPFEIGRHVRARGLFRRGPDTSPAADEWQRLQGAYFLEVEAIEPFEPAAGVGLYAGTLFVGGISGEGCPAFPNSLPIELVVAYSSAGVVAEPMSPGGGDVGAPIWPGWHVGPARDAAVELVTPMGLGRIALLPTAEGYEATYSYTLSGPACSVESTLELVQVH